MSKKFLSEKKLLEGITPHNAHDDELAPISFDEFGTELSETEYKMAMKRIEHIFDAVPNTQEGHELEKLILLAEAYENKHVSV